MCECSVGGIVREGSLLAISREKDASKSKKKKTGSAKPSVHMRHQFAHHLGKKWSSPKNKRARFLHPSILAFVSKEEILL